MTVQLKIEYGLLIQSEPDWLAEERRNLESYAKRLRGEIRDFVVGCSVKGEDTHCQFNDRWRLLGAIEYAKDSVLKG